MTSSASSFSSGLVACTLLEPDYVPGLGGLVNSLVRCGYRGRLLAGCRGFTEPPWEQPWQRTDYGWALTVVPGCVLELHEWAPERHFTYEKARWMRRIFDELAPDCTGVCYFDPDVVVRAGWGFFEAWLAGGVSVVEDLNADLGPRHPLRLYWASLLERHGRVVRVQRSRYVNAGFVGVSRSEREFLDDWQLAIDRAMEETRADKFWYAHLRPDPWAWPDQDALNAALMITSQPTSELGRNGMDFEPGGYVMSHATGNPKPWARRFIWEAVRNGQPPRRSDREFWAVVDGPLPLFPPWVIWLRRMSLTTAAALGRLLRRG